MFSAPLPPRRSALHRFLGLVVTYVRSPTSFRVAIDGFLSRLSLLPVVLLPPPSSPASAAAVATLLLLLRILSQSLLLLPPST